MGGLARALEEELFGFAATLEVWLRLALAFSRAAAGLLRLAVDFFAVGFFASLLAVDFFADLLRVLAVVFFADLLRGAAAFFAGLAGLAAAALRFFVFFAGCFVTDVQLASRRSWRPALRPHEVRLKCSPPAPYEHSPVGSVYWHSEGQRLVQNPRAPTGVANSAWAQLFQQPPP